MLLAIKAEKTEVSEVEQKIKTVVRSIEHDESNDVWMHW